MRQKKMKVKIKKLTDDAKIFNYAHEGDAGLDIYANEDKIIKSNTRDIISTGIAIAIDKGYVGLVWDKSGIASKKGIKTMGGVIDNGYRGEVKIVLLNTTNEDYTVEKGNKIAQMLIQKIERAEIDEVQDLDETIRGEGGFGSTGTK